MAFYQRKRQSPAINIVPLIDILAILLIFFIVTSTFKTPEAELKIELPESRTAVLAPSDNPPAILAVAEDGTILIDNQKTDLESLKEDILAFRERQPDLPIALKADENAPFGLIIQVMDALQGTGLEDLPTFTKPLEE